MIKEILQLMIVNGICLITLFGNIYNIFSKNRIFSS